MIVGKKQTIELLLVALMAEVHMLLADEINRAIPRTQSNLRSAKRRMKRLRYWPSRIKVWFFQ